MSQYSEMMGSFIRTGNYPMEANYIFPTEAALKEFYEDPINATTLHKGLLKVVENGGDGNQALYWVSKKQTNDELEFVKLIENIDIDNINDQLDEVSKKLEDEIKNRKDSETAIWGTNDPTNVPEELNSLLDLSVAITDLIKKVDDINSELSDSDNSIRKEVEAVAGTQSDDVIAYLQTLPYKSLTEAANALNKFLNTTDSDSNQINTLPELKSFLEGYNDTQKLRIVLLDLQAEILGKPIPTEDFRTLRAIEDFVRILKADTESTDRNLQSELDTTQIGVGLSGDGSYNADQETYYLKDATSIMNALKILDSKMYEAIKGITVSVSNKDVVDLSVRKELEGYVIGANLNLSNVLGNDLEKRTDGLYLNVKSTYSEGVLSLYVNDRVVSQHVLELSSIVESAYYDTETESIVIKFVLENGKRSTVTIPIGSIVKEWDVENSYPTKVVELEKETIDGIYKLSADVRISDNENNILKKVNNTLSVDGTTDSIKYKDKVLSTVIEELENGSGADVSKLEAKLDEEITRATTKETELATTITNLSTATNNSIAELKLKDADLQSQITNETSRATEVENAIKEDIQNLKDSDTTIKESIETLKTSVQTNADNINSNKELINSETTRAQEAEKNISNSVTAETTRATAAEEAIKTDITDLKAKDTELNNAITAEKERATTVEQTIQDSITNIQNDITNIKEDITNIEGDVTTINNNISNIETKLDTITQQQTGSEEAITNLDTKISNETTRATAKEEELANSISAETERATAKENEIETSVTTETNRAKAEETTLSKAITDEVARAKAEEEALSAAIDTKVGEVTITKSETSDFQYTLYVDKQASGEINIPQGQLLKSIEYDENTNSLVFTFTTDEGDKTTSVKLPELTTYSAGDGLQLTGNKFSILKDESSESYLEITENGVSITGVDTALAEKANASDLTAEISRAKSAEEDLTTKLGDKVDSVTLTKVSDLQYTINVNGSSIGDINIPKDQFLKSVELINDSTLRFIFETTTQTVTTDIDLTKIVSDSITEINDKISTLETTVATKADINSPTFTGTPKLTTAPEETDSSLNIPSTSWVLARIQEQIAKIDLSTYITKVEVTNLLTNKADLVDGIIPLSQLPTDNWIEVDN